MNSLKTLKKIGDPTISFIKFNLCVKWIGFTSLQQGKTDQVLKADYEKLGHANGGHMCFVVTHRGVGSHGNEFAHCRIQL